MNQNFEFSDDYIIYQYVASGYNDKWAMTVFNKYEMLLKHLQGKIKAKFRFLPLDYEDLTAEQFPIIVWCLKNFCRFYNKQFKNFLYQKYFWHLMNLMESFCSNKHKVLNWAETIDHDHSEAIADREWLTSWQWHKELVERAYKILSPREKNVIQLRLANFSHQAIVRITGWNYQSVDNSLQRAIGKLRLYYQA